MKQDLVHWPDPILAAVAVIAAAIVPLIVRLHVEPLSQELFGFWNGQRSNFDFFTYYKSRLIVGLGVVAAAGLVLRSVRSGDRAVVPWQAWVPALVYAAFAITSTLMSPLRDIALQGFPDRHEGLFVLLSYLAIAGAAYFALSTLSRIAFFVRAVALSAAVVSVIGMLQYAGLDPFQSALGRALILPGSQAIADLQYPVEARVVYATLFHYNYVGSYGALVLPFLASLTGEPFNRGTRWLIRASAAGLGVTWLVCGSRAGLAGGGVGLLLAAWAVRSRIRGRWRVVAPAIAAAMLLLVVFDLAAGGRLRNRAQSLVSDLRGLIGPTPSAAAPLPIELDGITAGTIRLDTPNGPLEVRLESGSIRILDLDRQQELPLAVDSRTGRFHIEDTRFSQIECAIGRINGQPALVLRQDAYVLNFLLLDTGIRLATKTGRTVPIEPVERFGFEGREGLGSARAYIWSRSLPLLKRTLILGSGPDTFAAVFPQHDFAGKFRVYGTTDMLVDKAHNWFLQVALDTGAPSAIATFCLLAWFLLRALLSPNGASGSKAVLRATAFGVAGYLVASAFNDSSVGVAPVFWCLLGLGIRLESAHPSST